MQPKRPQANPPAARSARAAPAIRRSWSPMPQKPKKDWDGPPSVISAISSTVPGNGCAPIGSSNRRVREVECPLRRLCCGKGLQLKRATYVQPAGRSRFDTDAALLDPDARGLV